MKIASKFILVCVLVMSLAIALGAQSQNYEFRMDGNLIKVTENTQSGTLEFVVNEGFMSEPNHSMIFCSSLAKAVDLATCLYSNKHREKLYSEIIWTLACQPAIGAVAETDSMLMTSWILGKYDDIVNVMDKFRTNYWSAEISKSALHNSIAKTLRTINPKNFNGQVMKMTNLKAVQRVLFGLDIGMTVSAATVGAVIQSALYSDLALERLSILEDTLGAFPDPALKTALARVRADLTWGDERWKAFFIELWKQRDLIINKGFEVGLKAVCTALGIHGAPAVLLIFETIASDWEQHAHAQRAVLAATVEATLAAAAGRETGTPRGCELERMAATARFLYFDCMLEVTSAWQGYVVDLLRKGSPYADAKRYFSEQRQARLSQLETARREVCWVPDDATPAASATASEAVLVIDSSGSMADNDPRQIRIQAAQMLAGRLISDQAVSIVDFDHRATSLVTHETRLDPINNAISGIDSSGQTCIPLGLEAAATVLKDAGGAGTVILFTDGQNTSCQGDVPAWFLTHRVPVYVIGLSDSVNELYLQNIAFSTGGEYMKASQASDLPGIFDWIGTMAGMEDLVDEFSGKIAQGNTDYFAFSVDSTSKRLTCRVSYPGSSIALDLIAPDGQLIDKNVQGVKHLIGTTYELIEVENPMTGTWKARLTAVETDPQGEAFNVRVGVKSSSPVSVETTAAQIPGGGYRFAFQFDRSVIKAKSFEGKIIYPNGSSAPLTQVSTGHWEVPKPKFGGIHQFLFYLQGTDGSGLSLKRIALKSLYFDGPKMPNNPVITRIIGAIGTISMGQNIGLRPGMRLEIRNGDVIVGYAYILSVFYDYARIEFTEPKARTWQVNDEVIPIRAPER
jgi:Mg-chelatase subunit ChlD